MSLYHKGTLHDKKEGKKMKIVTYRPEYREAFVRLNTEWLTRLYWVESFD